MICTRKDELMQCTWIFAQKHEFLEKNCDARFTTWEISLYERRWFRVLKTPLEVSKLRIGLLPIMLKNAKKKELMTIGNKSCFTFIKKLVKKSCLCDKNSWSIILVNCQEALIKTLLPLLVFCNKQPCLFVEQKCVVFHFSLRSNICYGCNVLVTIIIIEFQNAWHIASFKAPFFKKIF